MNFRLTEEQEKLKMLARRLAREKFVQKACRWEGQYPEENVKKLSELGLLGVSLPEEFGGGGLTILDEVIIQEELGRVCPDTAWAISCVSMPRMIAEFGDKEQKQRYLPPFTKGEGIIGLAMTESEAGSDVGHLRTRAREEGGAIIIDGEKIFISHADVASAFIVYVRFEEGIGTVIVDKVTPGLLLSKPDYNMAGGAHHILYFDGCRVTKSNVLKRGKGAFREIMTSFNAERCLSAMWALSTALCGFDKALKYSQEREQFKRKLCEFQGLQWMLANMAMEIEAARLLIYRAAANAAAGAPSRFETSFAKAFACEVSEKVVSDALQIHGGYGYMRGQPLEYLYRLVRGRKIAGGTVEIQHDIIAGELLKKGLV